MNVVVVEGTVVALIGQAGMGKVNVLVIWALALLVSSTAGKQRAVSVVFVMVIFSFLKLGLRFTFNRASST
jgi:hypothetical protein